MDHLKHKPIAVTEHLFQLGTKSFPAYLSMGDIGMIIEGGTGPTWDIIVSQVENLGIDPAVIKYMFLTHTHPDHVGGIPRIKKLWPHVKIRAGETAAGFLEKDTFVKDFLPSDRIIAKILISRGDIDEMPAEPVEYKFEVDEIVKEWERIDLGKGVIWTVFETPGHSPCHLSLLEDKEGTMVIGDMTGYYDPELGVFWPNYFSSLEQYCASIHKMMNLAANRILLSHNGVIEGNPRQYFEKALNATEVYHREMVDRVDSGEEKDRVCKEKTDWVVSLGALSSYKTINFLTKLLMNRSHKERGKGIFSSIQTQAA